MVLSIEILDGLEVEQGVRCFLHIFCIILRLPLELFGTFLCEIQSDNEIHEDGTEVKPEELLGVKVTDDANGESDLKEGW